MSMPTRSAKKPARSAPRVSRSAPADAASRFLELYYPIHYQAGIKVEDAMRGGELSRHQVAILWLVRAEGEGGRRMNRKAIERSLGSWFEISGAAITKALRSMSQAPRKLVELQEDPRSGREKVVVLTGAGEDCLRAMVERGEAYIQRIVDRMNDAEVVNGIHFFERINAIVRTLE
jgi:DNA-binding MarR family transcriptional regulator